MDLDAFTAAHRDQWERLDRLTSRRRLTGAQADELVILYRACARHLSRVRSSAPDPQLVAELSTRIAAARARLTGTRELRLGVVTGFVLQTLPAALYRIRWWTLGVATAEILLAVVVGAWVLRSPEAMSMLGTPSERHTYANSAFEEYYSTDTPTEFAALVWTSNARLTCLCVAGGITGVVPVVLLVANAVNLGRAGAVMADHGLLGKFFSLILPHGLLELTCVFIAAAAGLRLFWMLLVPGRRSRGKALATEGRALMVVVIGLTAALAVSGIIEAFVTPAPVPWGVKMTVGVLVFLLLWLYILVLGRRADARGVTGDLISQDDSGYAAPEAG